MSDPSGNSAPKAPLTFAEAYKFYEDGKHRRYELLFSVNGGAFAIANLIGTKPGLGNLRLPYVALGMILFSIVMVFDIYTFGEHWRAIGHEIAFGERYEMFGRRGRFVLLTIGLLICLGWALAGVIRR